MAKKTQAQATFSWRLLDTLGVDGRLPGAPLQTPVQKVSVNIGGATAQTLYAGAAPGYAGMMQVNAQLDANAPQGALPAIIQVGSKTAQPATVNVQ